MKLEPSSAVLRTGSRRSDMLTWDPAARKEEASGDGSGRASTFQVSLSVGLRNGRGAAEWGGAGLEGGEGSGL